MLSKQREGDKHQAAWGRISSPLWVSGCSKLCSACEL
jgi:hypothetical protein